MGDPLGSPRVAPLFAASLSRCLYFVSRHLWTRLPIISASSSHPRSTSVQWDPPRLVLGPGTRRRNFRATKLAGSGPKRLNFAPQNGPNGASPVGHGVGLGTSFACICCGPRNTTRISSYADFRLGAPEGGFRIRGLILQSMMGAIIPALMHRIPSELRS